MSYTNLHPRKAPNRTGAVALLLLASLAVLLGVVSMAINLSWLTSHQVQLRNACQSAALAGAAELLDPAPQEDSTEPDPAAAVRAANAIQRANLFFTSNTNTVLQTSGDDPDVLPGWSADPTMPLGTIAPWNGEGPVNALSVRGVRRRSNGQAVVLWFGNLFGVNDAEPAAVAAASMDQRIYGFRPLEYVNVPMTPLLVLPAGDQWPPSVAGAMNGFTDNYSVDPRTGDVAEGPDGVGEITLRLPAADGPLPAGQAYAVWISLGGETADFSSIEQQVGRGLTLGDLASLGGQFALGGDGTLAVSAAPAADASQVAALQAALLSIRGKKRIWPIGAPDTAGGESVYRATGFVAGCVVDCRLESGSLSIVVQGCTIQTCTGLLRSGMARNPWIGKLILNE
jgi:hypothetical protein